MNQKGFNFIGLIIFALFVSVVAFFYIRSQDSLPSDRLYPVKSIREAIFYATNSLNYESMVNANVTLANERVKEVSKLVENQAREELIKDTLLRLTDHQRKALDYALRIKARGSFIPDYLDKIEVALLEHQRVLSNLYYYLPHSLYADLDSTIKTTNELLEQDRANRK